MSGISVQGLTKIYGDAVAVDDLELTVEDGEFLTLLGPSGCGKTTTLRCIAGLERPEKGEIRIGNDVVVSAQTGRFVPPNKRDTGMVFQSYALWPHMTVFANVAYPLRMRHTGRADVRRRVHEVLRAVGLGDYPNRSATALSGGQQQRVALARAMVARPRVLLFDEPLSNLDAKLRAEMRVELRAMHDRIGTTSIYVTHDQLEAMTLSDRVVVMNHGHIQQIGAPREIYWRPCNRFVADFVGFENFFAAELGERRGTEVRVHPVNGGPPLWCASGTTTAAAHTAQFAVRSTGVHMSPHGDDRPNVVDCRILRATFLGEQVEYEVDAGGLSLIVRVPDSGEPADDKRALRVGDSARVEIPPTNVVMLAQADGVGEAEPETVMQEAAAVN